MTINCISIDKFESLRLVYVIIGVQNEYECHLRFKFRPLEVCFQVPQNGHFTNILVTQISPSQQGDTVARKTGTQHPEFILCYNLMKLLVCMLGIVQTVQTILYVIQDNNKQKQQCSGVTRIVTSNGINTSTHFHNYVIQPFSIEWLINYG